MNGLLLSLLILLGIVLFVGAPAAMVMLTVFLAKQISGGQGSFGRLAEQYSINRRSAENPFVRQTVQVGAVVYKRCVTLAVEPEGLYIAKGKKRLLIAWREFKSVGRTRLHWQVVPLLTIGDPTVATMTVPIRIFELMRPFLLATTQVTEPSSQTFGAEHAASVRGA